jgi:hypothetical protein
MHCPRCGLQQASDSLRFCSRCGQSLTGLAEWLSGNALLVTQEPPAARLLSPRRKGMKRGAKIMFISGVLTPVFLAMSFMVDDPGPLIFPFILFLVGLTITLYTWFFVDALPPANSPAAPTNFVPAPHYQALPHGSNTAFSGGVPPSIRTAELAQPNSVTDHTTKLLDDPDGRN